MNWLSSYSSSNQPPSLFKTENQAIYYSVGKYFYWFLNWHTLMWSLLITTATPIPVQYHRTRYIFTAWNVFQFISKLRSIDFPLVDNQWNPHPVQYNKQAVLYWFKMWSNWIPTYQSLICSLLSTNSTPIPVQCHKTRYILLLGKLFQLIS